MQLLTITAVPKVKLNYNDFINAIYDAIDKEAAASGDEATDEENIYFSKTFDELMEEAKNIWIKATWVVFSEFSAVC